MGRGRKWIEIEAKGPVAKADLAAEALVGAGSPGIMETLRDGRRAALKAYLPKRSTKKIELLKKELRPLGWGLKTRLYEEGDWTEKWKRGLRPITVSLPHVKKKIIVKSTWQKIEPSRGDAVVFIDPGMAFGTGSHPTTRNCLKALLNISNKSKRKDFESILDVGTGSGVLSIAAMKLGARRAVGTDIDKDALKVARFNARLNNVKLTTSALPPGKVRGSYDVVVANILSHVVIEYMEDLFSRLKEGGYLILSGLLAEEKPEVDEAALKQGLKRFTRYHGYHNRDPWCVLVYRKPEA